MSEPAPESPYAFLVHAIGWSSFGVFVAGVSAGNVWASAVAVIALCAMGYGIARLIAAKG
jgi:uncharacterized membrane protein YjjB (DUF3815 family)